MFDEFDDDFICDDCREDMCFDEMGKPIDDSLGIDEGVDFLRKMFKM